MNGSMLKNELNDIILKVTRSVIARLIVETTYPELVLHQICGVLVKFVQQRPRLLFRKMFEASLQHATAVWVGRKFIHVPTESINEVQSVG